jgi:hypothetical protein
MVPCPEAAYDLETVKSDVYSAEIGHLSAPNWATCPPQTGHLVGWVGSGTGTAIV